ncbi:MAG: 4-(cytidine 5'-diphospho)-2-C-methyl-D-erythritol kinase [Thermaurantiacus sp.]
MQTGATEPAPAKINLALHVRERMPDGWHRLETLFAFTAFGDLLEARPADGWSLEVRGRFAAAAGPLDDNIVLRAARAFAKAAGSPACFALTLEKRIPAAAGLGGGSADAAAALRLLNRLSVPALDETTLREVAAGLGADVPACLVSKASRGEGRGDMLTAVDMAAGQPVLLVNPGVEVPTGRVFACWDGVDRGPLKSGDPLAASLAGRNDLEAPALGLAPAIGEVLAFLKAAPGVVLARMSGSGATCFALFASARARDAAAARVPPQWWHVATRLV